MLSSQTLTYHSVHIHQINILVDVVDNVPHARVAGSGITIVIKNLDSLRTDALQDVHTPQ